MALQELADSQYSIPKKQILTYLLLTFGLTWGIAALYIFASETMTNLFGALSGSHPLFFLATWSPAIAAIIIILYEAGLQNLMCFFRKLFLWRASKAWYLFILIGIPILFYAGALWKGTLFSEAFPFESIQAFIPVFLLAICKGPIEEFGWRGFALPIFQRMLSPFWAALCIGIIWGIWHLPAFLLSGTEQSSWSILPFLFGTIMISIIISALYNDTKGSILLAALMHFQLNNPLWPDAQPYDSYLLGFVVIAILFIQRKKMFSKSDCENQVVY